jgi:hypothetical protein
MTLVIVYTIKHTWRSWRRSDGKRRKRGEGGGESVK